MDEYYFLSFDSTNYALQAESYFKKNNFNITIIPTPREVTQSCGLSIKFNDSCVNTIKRAIDGINIKTKGIYFLKKENGKPKIEKID